MCTAVVAEPAACPEMEAAGSLKMLVNFYQDTLHHALEESNIYGAEFFCQDVP
jgi:hypothetical protein